MLAELLHKINYILHDIQFFLLYNTTLGLTEIPVPERCQEVVELVVILKAAAHEHSLGEGS